MDTFVTGSESEFTNLNHAICIPTQIIPRFIPDDFPNCHFGLSIKGIYNDCILVKSTVYLAPDLMPIQECTLTSCDIRYQLPPQVCRTMQDCFNRPLSETLGILKSLHDHPAAWLDFEFIDESGHPIMKLLQVSIGDVMYGFAPHDELMKELKRYRGNFYCADPRAEVSILNSYPLGMMNCQFINSQPFMVAHKGERSLASYMKSFSPSFRKWNDDKIFGRNSGSLAMTSQERLNSIKENMLLSRYFVRSWTYCNLVANFFDPRFINMDSRSINSSLLVEGEETSYLGNIMAEALTTVLELMPY